MRTGRCSLTSKQERINALRDHIHSQISYGSGFGDAIRTIVDGVTDMLLVLAEDERKEIARQVAWEMWNGPIPGTLRDTGEETHE